MIFEIAGKPKTDLLYVIGSTLNLSGWKVCQFEAEDAVYVRARKRGTDLWFIVEGDLSKQEINKLISHSLPLGRG